MECLVGCSDVGQPVGSNWPPVVHPIQDPYVMPCTVDEQRCTKARLDYKYKYK